ncbi:hypothetical protein B14911_28150 [Bacillus sp. NRRL B-14911]|nr:hypothetical protein B14911_28150 [Bacillus sp. NRRL B-14911]
MVADRAQLLSDFRLSYVMIAEKLQIIGR